MSKPISFLFIVALFAGQFIACKKDAANAPTLPPNSANIAGNFTVSSFITSSDETATFSGYRFVFSDNGSVTATQDGVTTTGTWRFDDSDNSELKLSFANAPLSELNKGWHISELTTEHMLLTDDDDSHEGGDDNATSHDRLDFQRE